MSTMLAEMPLPRALLLCAVPLAYLAAALFTATARAPAQGWRRARFAALAALLASALSLVWLLVGGAALARGPLLASLGAWGELHLGLRSDPLGGVMLLLVCFIGWVITGYSQPYLDGEAGQQRFQRSLMLTLAAVSALVLSNNLLWLALAWIGTSLALHGLLTFYDTRPQALIAAHKKFLASRVADLCLLGAVALVGTSLGTLEIDRAIAAARAQAQVPGALPAALQVAALLFVAAALLKCAQLPVHGWLIQVMEAPTPVSALLHAGVVNLGGFLLIRLATLVSDVPAAQALLVVVGSLTAVVAGLVMMTRISIKVSLAWSTCAQMGFMLMQCGLGLYELALLHLVAHSLYKAYAFLAAGGTVEQNRLQQMTPPAPTLGVGAWAAGALAGLVLAGAAALAWGIRPDAAPALWAVGGILGMALAPLLAGPIRRAGGWWSMAGVGAAFAVALAYFGLHLVFGAWLGTTAPGTELSAPTSPLLVAWVLGSFALLFIVQGVLRARPQGALAHTLYPYLFAGFYLDEAFTRLTFRVWPARVAARVNARLIGRVNARTLPAASTLAAVKPAQPAGLSKTPS